MTKTRREWLKDTLCAGAVLAAAPLSLMSTESEQERNLALNRAAYASSSSDFINTGHMATDGRSETQWLSKDTDPQWVRDIEVKVGRRSLPGGPPSNPQSDH
jgi:hypothetical protein